MSMHRMSSRARRSSNSTVREKTRASRALHSAASFTVEKLEKRRLLTTWTGGGVVDGVVQENTYTYLDANENTVKVALWGTMTAEFLFVRVNGATNGTTVVSAVAPTTANIAAENGADLFAIYVASASPTASIAIAQEDTTADSGFPMEGFAASGVNAITVNNAQTGKALIVTPASDSGSVYIGARAYLKPAAGLKGAPADGTPILSVALDDQVGVRPVTSDDTLNAGLETAPGVSLNRFFLGGQITGRVDIGGSINTFYAGDIYTGDADGITAGTQPQGSFVRNFNVAGDIDNLISLGDIGTNAVSLAGKPTYQTGFRLTVDGHIGQVKSEDSIDGSFYAQNLSTLKGLGLPQTEVSRAGPTPPTDSGETFFEGNAPSADGSEGVPSLVDRDGGATTVFDADTPQQAQFLGTPFSSAQGHNAIQLEGTVDNATDVNNPIDIYAVALDADQTITATLNVNVDDVGALVLGILAPDAGYGGTESATSLVASTYDARNGLRLTNQPLTFTSTDAGVYYFAVAYYGDTSFNGATATATTDGGTILGPVDYELDVTGVKNLGIGAIAAVNDIAFPSGVAFNSTTGIESSEPSLRVDTGDLGALISTSGATIIAGDADGATLPITATTGNIRVIQSGNIGALATATYAFGPDIRSAGNVGVIRTTDDEAAGGVMLVNDDIAAPGDGTPIGGSYQLVDCAGLLVSSFVADGSIGTIRAEDIGITDYAPVFQVNADSSKTPGVIDLIDMTGNGTTSSHFGTLGAGGPKISTGPNGDVRYIHIAPDATIYNDLLFGGEEDEPITYAAGAAASLIDDSGTPFTITPYRGTTVSGDASAATTTTGTTTTTSDETSTITGDALSLQTYGIEDKGGVVVISLTATAGDIDVTTSTTSTTTTTGTLVTHAEAGPTSISVTTSAAGSKGSVEFGEVNLVGGGTELTFDPTTRTFTSAAGGANAVAEDDSATFSGKSPIDVYDLAVTEAALAGSGTGTLEGATSIVNSTSGEIVSFHAQGVQTLKAASLGVAHSDVSAPVTGATVIANAFPFHDLRSIIQIGGTMIGDGDTGDPTAVGGDAVGAAETIESTGPLGNILTNGTIDNILPDVGAAAGKGVAEGIDGPIYAASPNEYSTPSISTVSGNILNINIGQGLGYSGSGNYATTGIFADNYIGTVTNQHGSDIRGDIVSEGAAGGLPAAETISPITGLPITTKGPVGTYINNITLSGGGSIIDANIFTTTSIDQAIESTDSKANAYLVTTPNTSTNGNTNDAEYAIGSIDLSGDGGIIGTLMYIGGVNTISVPGFGIFTTYISSQNDDVVNSINAGGYGIRSSTITGQNSIGSIDASGDGKELAVTHYSSTVRQSETGAVTDAFSGQPLDVYDDIDEFLGTSAKKSTRKGSTEGGVIADTTLTGTYQLGSLTAWRIVGHPEPADPTTAQLIAEYINYTPPMTISFANNIGKIDVSENTTDLTITTGSLNTFESGDDVVGTTFNVAGEIKTMTAGFINGSSYINATGPDGVIDYLATTGGLNAEVNASVGIDEILVGTDLGSTNITSGGNLDELYVKGSVLKGASIVVARTLGTLTIRHNFLGGSTIQARSITTKNIGGVINGNFIIVPASP